MKHTRTHTKRALALLLTLSLFVSLSGLTAFADDNDPPPQTTQLKVDNDTASPLVVDHGVDVSTDDAVIMRVSDGAEHVVTVNGDVSTDDGRGVYVGTGGDGTSAALTVNGDVMADGSSYHLKDGVSVVVQGVGNSVDVTVNGSVTTEGRNPDGYDAGIALEVTGDQSSGRVAVDGDVSGTGYGIFVVYKGDDPKAMVVVDGDVSGDCGVEFCLTDSASGTNTNADVVITGTLKGDDAGVWIRRKDTGETAELTVWQIDAPEGKLVAKNPAFGNATAEEFKAFTENNIHYIVKIADGSTISAAKEDGGALDTKTFTKAGESVETTVQTAVQDTVVTLIAPKGYEIVSAANGSGSNTIALTKNANGLFTYTVPLGGGVLLSAVLRALESQGPGLFDSSVSDAAIVVLQLVFEDGAGGAAAVSVAQNKPFTMPAAPAREGWRFLGWEAEIDGETVTFAPGERVKLSEAVVFRALWAPTVGEEAAMKLAIRES